MDSRGDDLVAEAEADDFKLVAPSGALVVRPDRLDARSRARAMTPSAFTLANMLLGFSSMRAAQDGRLHLAAILIAVAILFDIFDGAVARAVGAITPFGLQFDSLADLISFGIAPATLLYSWSLSDLHIGGERVHLLGWAIAGFWLACAAFRLARFNVTIDPAGDKRYFIGLASPGAAGIVIASVFAFTGDFTGWQQLFPVAIAILPAAMMVSPFRFTSFRFIASPRRDRVWVSVLVVALLVAGLAVVPVATGLVVAYGYFLVAPIGWLTRPLRRRLFGPDAVAPPRRNLPSVFFLVDPSAAVDEPSDPA
ncbi:MAG: CDP-diacylglycerol--serine O-phosphatidyltransferase [Acidimicrobiales bacterium]|nr:CDP-diacylglycerol--serine O-phosphatidyltransferase [Acidimicrobiales bacterium]